MSVREAVLAVLADSEEPLHWTAVLDRALRSGRIDPFTTPDVRGEVLRALRALAREGELVVESKGVYRLRRSG